MEVALEAASTREPVVGLEREEVALRESVAGLEREEAAFEEEALMALGAAEIWEAPSAPC
jgi:hypothetical protein